MKLSILGITQPLIAEYAALTIDPLTKAFFRLVERVFEPCAED